eukprot:TRINITY_DN15222_c0_g1_i1.p1 TRINITY_DN15222_c0_g1~~TRINITY_DN15222_c0_g1_i1.p1  ORF type:complete len:171 (-),score=17.70 TRINITY_DN15222_c0_g1_i1:83-532(-)
MAHDSTTLDRKWKAALKFVRKGPSASLQFVADNVRAELYALEAQAIQGPCTEANALPTPMEDQPRRLRREAWIALGDLSTSEAKKQFVDLITKIIPDWEDWEGLQDVPFAENAQPGDGMEGEAEGLAQKLLRAFQAKMNVSLPSVNSRL